MTQGEALMQIAATQMQAPPLLLEAERLKYQGDLEKAISVYGRLTDLLKEQLKLILLYNERYAGSNKMDTGTTVNPLLDALFMKADLVEALGALTEAESLRNEALNLSGKYLTGAAVAERERQRALSLITQGRFNEALSGMSAVRDIFEREGNAIGTATVTKDIAALLEWLGDFERAIEEIEHASSLIKPYLTGREVGHAEIVDALLGGRLSEAEEATKLMQINVELDQTRARVCRYSGRLDEAEELFVKVLPMIPEAGRVGIEFQIAAILIAKGRYGEGLEYANRLEPYFKGLARPKLGVLLKLQAEALMGLGDIDGALTKLDEAISDMSDYYDPDSLWKLQWLQGRAFETTGRPGKAIESYCEAAETVNSLRKAPLGYRLDSTYLKDKMPLFVSAISLAANIGDAATCCRLMEMIKSRILTTTLSIPATDRAGAVSDLDLQFDDLSRQIDAIEYQAYETGWSSDLCKRRDELISNRTALFERICVADPRWRSLTAPVPLDLDSLQDMLAERHQAALNLFLNENMLTGVLLKDGRSVVFRNKVEEGVLAKLEVYLGNLQSAETSWKYFDPSGQLSITAESLIPSEIIEQALESDSLIISPHGRLHLLPFAGLTYKLKRLFEHCPVGILPNLSCIPRLAADFSKQPKAAIIGIPDYDRMGLSELAGSAEEVKVVEEIYSSEAGLVGSAYTGENATQENFKTLLGHEESQGEVLHMSCHGKFYALDPMSSGLLLTDGKIDAAEIARSRVCFFDVVLSACYTGLRPDTVKGIELAGDDILGLPGAFLEAGARSVLVSIPPANDLATMSLMTVYHENRADGMSPLMALQTAQKYMLSNSAYEPASWIGFTVYGYQ